MASTDLTTTDERAGDLSAADDAATTERTRFESLLDAALALPAGRVQANVAALRRAHPDATPAEILTQLEDAYVRSVKRTSGAVGAVATVPAIGTGIAAVLTAGTVGTFLARSATFVLAVAEVHGVHIADASRRRTLVLASLLGQEGVDALEGQVGLGTLGWARTALTRLPLGTVRGVNRGLTSRLARRFATRGGLLAVGRLAPFGVGAIIGWTGGRAVARNVVESAREAFGPAPETFAAAE
ncbi:hypothetical protein [Georgenia wangjunii]|uniref:hypothetical protein n=1 Tax=Georgenia wangjunii TaxID=3117730 RepID=UPI002F269CE2